MNRIKLGTIVAALGLAACSANQSMPSAAPYAPNALSAAVSHGSAAVDFVVVVPGAAQTNGRVRRPRYISPSTQSVAIDLDHKRLLVLDVAPTSSACKHGANGSRRCSGHVNVSAGTQSFEVTAYDGTNANGNILASGTVTQKIRAGAPQQIGLSLTGKPANMTLSLASAYPPAGTPAKIAVTVAMLDADGNTIVGSYGMRVQLSDSDRSGATKLSAPGVLDSATQVQLSYDGSSVANTTITAKARGLADADAVFAPSPTTVAQYPAPMVKTKNGVFPMGVSDVVLGPDGNMWATGASIGTIEKISADGHYTTYTNDKLIGSGPAGINVGPDHNLWFAGTQNGTIAKITASGAITIYTIPVAKGAFAQPGWITAGPDGREWFVDQGQNAVAVGAITPAGKMTLYPLPQNAFPQEIITGPDGNLWITDGGLNAILVVSTSGKLLANHPIPTAKAAPWGITVGPDKNIWFAEYGSNQIGRMTLSGHVKEFTVPTSFAGPLNVASGPDGNVWFTETGGGFWDLDGKVGYITTDGSVIREFPGGTIMAHVHNLAFDAKGNLWYTKFNLSYSAVDKLVI